MEKPEEKNIAKMASPFVEELTRVYEQAQKLRFSNGALTLIDALHSDDRHMSSMAAVEANKLVSKLTELVVADKNFPGTESKSIRALNGASGFYPNFIAIPLLRKALQSGSPKDAIAWLQKVLKTNTATGNMIEALWGVKVDHEIAFMEGVRLIPIADLPASANKEWITNVAYSTMSSPIVTALNFTPPQSALISAHTIEPFFFDASASKDVNVEYLKTNELLKEIALVLTSIGPRVAISAAQWFTFDDPDLDEANMLSRGRSIQMLEILPRMVEEYPVLNSSEAQEIVSAYFKLTEDCKAKVRVALQRLNQALRRHNTGDRAVELATGLESLFGDSDNSEMTHKVRMRTTRIIGGTEEERIITAQLIKRMYEIRSKLVHTGHVDLRKTHKIGDQTMNASGIVDAAVHICARAIKTIIRRGSIPDWSIFDIVEHSTVAAPK